MNPLHSISLAILSGLCSHGWAVTQPAWADNPGANALAFQHRNHNGTLVDRYYCNLTINSVTIRMIHVDTSNVPAEGFPIGANDHLPGATWPEWNRPGNAIASARCPANASYRTRFSQAYWMAEGEVTMRQWQAVLSSQPPGWPANPTTQGYADYPWDATADKPVAFINISDISTFTTALTTAIENNKAMDIFLPDNPGLNDSLGADPSVAGTLTGAPALPTAAEWEFAARGNDDSSYPLPWPSPFGWDMGTTNSIQGNAYTRPIETQFDLAEQNKDKGALASLAARHIFPAERWHLHNLSAYDNSNVFEETTHRFALVPYILDYRHMPDLAVPYFWPPRMPADDYSYVTDAIAGPEGDVDNDGFITMADFNGDIDGVGGNTILDAELAQTPRRYGGPRFCAGVDNDGNGFPEPSDLPRVFGLIDVVNHEAFVDSYTNTTKTYKPYTMARPGTTGYDANNDWRLDEAGRRLRVERHLYELQTSRRNAFGLIDMFGNVAEWTRDTWDGRSPYDTATANAASPADGHAATTGAAFSEVRGGSWRSSALRARPSTRIAVDPTTRNDETGFRFIILEP